MNNEEIIKIKIKSQGILHITEYKRFWHYITNLQEENEYYKQKIDIINKYLQKRLIEFRNAGKSRKDIKAHHYYMLIQYILMILQEGDN